MLKGEMNMLYLVAHVRFDKPIDIANDSIVVGGFTMTFSNKKTVTFDFREYTVLPVCCDRQSFMIVARDLDIEVFEDSAFLNTFNGSVKKIKDFSLYVEDSDIRPVALHFAKFYGVDDTGNTANTIRIPQKLTNNIWSASPN
jgi:hypothetical protein